MDVKNRKIIIAYSIICIILIYSIGQLLPSSYYISLLTKLPSFVVIPYLINHFILKSKINFKLKKSDIKLMLATSVFVIGIIVIAYLLVQGFIDIETIKNDFISRQKIDKAAFIYPVLYTIFVNAMIEEYFFRGFIFQGLSKSNCKSFPWLGAIFSSLLFAVYHLAIFVTWFSLPILFLALFGLFAGGMIFAYFVYRTESLLASYIIHLSADVGVVIVGVFMMGLFN